MKKKLTALSLALLLSLSLLTVGQGARANEPDPDPIPVVTIQPGDPEKPEEPPADTQGDPSDGNKPNPVPVEY